MWFVRELNGGREIHRALVGGHVQQAERASDAQLYLLRYAKPDSFIRHQQIGVQAFGKSNHFGFAGIQTEDFLQARDVMDFQPYRWRRYPVADRQRRSRIRKFFFDRDREGSSFKQAR